MSKKETNQLSFEEAMEKLEDIVQKMEENELPLEEAIAVFQQGMTLSQLCHQKLQTVEKQIHTLVEKNGELTMEPMEENE